MTLHKLAMLLLGLNIVWICCNLLFKLWWWASWAMAGGNRLVRGIIVTLLDLLGTNWLPWVLLRPRMMWILCWLLWDLGSHHLYILASLVEMNLPLVIWPSLLSISRWLTGVGMCNCTHWLVLRVYGCLCFRWWRMSMCMWHNLGI